MSWREEYEKRRNVKLYFKDKIVDTFPISEINEEAKNRIKSFFVDKYPIGILELRPEFGYLVQNPITKELLLKEGSRHAESYINTINKIAEIKNLNLRANFLPSPNYYKKVEAVGKIELESCGKENLLNPLSTFNRLLLNQASVNFFHSLIYQFIWETEDKRTKIAEICYLSKAFPESLKEKNLKFNLKQPYQEAYSLKDISKIVKHYELVGDLTAEYCEGYGISLNCIRPRDWFKILKQLVKYLPKEYEWVEMDRKTSIEQYVTFRNWPSSLYPKRGPIKIEKKKI